MKIAIVGFGLEGRASFDYWNTSGNDLTIVDERDVVDGIPQGTTTLLGADVFSQLADFDLIIRSPSVHPKKLPYGDKVWSATNEFFAKCPAPIIGVTGTKGKGTTSSLITNMLRTAGKTVHLVGNIGAPALEALEAMRPSDIVVYELSSFQLWDLQRSPHVAVVLGIEPDHLDVHTDFDDYVRAKMHITLEQNDGDVVIFNSSNEWSQKIAEVSSADTVIAYPFAIDEFKDSLNIPGAHNQENASAAIAAVRQFDVSDNAIHEGLASFTGLPHRLKFVREVNGVKFYDDSIATTPGSAIAAIKSFAEPKVLILGGSDKGADYSEIIELCDATNTGVIAIGETGAVVAELCVEFGVAYVRELGNMGDIVATAYKIAESGDVIILSPASASFDMFKSYADRGDRFIEAVERL